MFKMKFDRTTHTTYESGEDAFEIIINKSYPEGFYFNKNNPESDYFYKKYDSLGRLLVIFDLVDNTIDGAWVGVDNNIVFDEEARPTSSLAEEYICSIEDELDDINFIINKVEHYPNGNGSIWYSLSKEFKTT